MTRMVYLAYPIDQAPIMASMVHFFEIVNEAKRVALETGVSITFDPGDAFSVAPKTKIGPEIGLINSIAAAQADGVLAFIGQGMATMGVPIEIDRAVGQGKHVAIVTDTQSWMLNYDLPNVRTFPLTMDGGQNAAEWVAVQPDGDVIDRTALPVRVLEEGGRLPSRAYHDDAGLDLVVARDTWVSPGVTVDVPCGVAVELPNWSWGLILGRSSTRRDRGLLVHPGVIDSGWRGPLFVSVENPTNADVAIKEGERIGQIIIMTNQTQRFEPVEVVELSPHPRGENGFGSSGK